MQPSHRNNVEVEYTMKFLNRLQPSDRGPINNTCIPCCLLSVGTALHF